MSQANNNLAIKAVELGKSYKMYAKPIAMLKELLTGKIYHTQRWALKNVSFSVARGEIVGVLGNNGAGKSTLLKILAGTLDKTTGSLEINGKISAILELGTGFHPQYTGRQNIFMGGMCLGMSKQELEDKLDWIIDFSELRAVIDQPFHTYSSGMQARLTFATAVSVNPDIFIVDEALAAGDSAFVEKCLLRMEEIIASGSTVFLVSHNTNLITRFCKRALWLHEGELKRDDDAEKIAKEYEIFIYSQANRYTAHNKPQEEVIVVGDQKIRIDQVSVKGTEVAKNIFLQGKALSIEINFTADIASDSLCFYLAIMQSNGLCVWTSTNYNYLDDNYNHVKKPIQVHPGKHVVKLTIPTLLLNSGSYYLNIGIEPYPNIARISDYHDYKTRCAAFSVVRPDNLVLNKVFDCPANWTHQAQQSVYIDSVKEEKNQINIELKKFPHPYSSMISLSNDCEFMSFESYLDIYRILCGPNGLGLESSTSLFFYLTNAICHSSFSYFADQNGKPGPHCEIIREMIQAGFIDTIHAYGDFDAGGFTRPMAEKVLLECNRYNLKIPIWTNHGSDKNFQNLGHKALTNYQTGDLKDSDSYHLDLLKNIGLQYAWVDDGFVSHPLEDKAILYHEIARDDSKLHLFRRYRGLAGKPAPMAGSFAEQIQIADIKQLISSEKSCIYYQHLGAWERKPNNLFIANSKPYFCENGFKVLYFLSDMMRQKKCLTTTTFKLLQYLDMRDSIQYYVKENVVFIESPSKDFSEQSFKGLTFKLPAALAKVDYKIIYKKSNGTEIILPGKRIDLANGEFTLGIPWGQPGEFIW